MPDIRNLRAIETVVIGGGIIETAGPLDHGRDGQIVDCKALVPLPEALPGIEAHGD